MKRKLPVLIAIAIALIIMLAACQSQKTPAQGRTELPPATQPAPEPTQNLPIDVPTEPTVPASVATEPPVPAPANGSLELTGEDAINKALSHAGLTKSQVSRLEAEKDLDNGMIHYDVEFETPQWEYDYEIHAETGKVLKSEKERND